MAFKCRHLAVTMLSLLLGGGTPPASAAEPGIEEALEGFDEPAPTAETNLDEVMEGFEGAPVEDTGELDRLLEGFDEVKTGVATLASATPKSAWQWSGAITLAAAYNYTHDAPDAGTTDFRGFSRLRTKLNLELERSFGTDWRFHVDGYGFKDFIYSLRDGNHYTRQVRSAYEDEGELGELFLQGSLSDNLDLKLGRQIVVWGKSDNLRVTDVVNPLDLRETGMVDIEDLRLPLTMLRLDGYRGDWSFSGLIIPEIRFNKTAPFGSDFYAFPGPQPDEIEPADGGSNTEYALAANGIFSGWDLAFYAARIFNDRPHQETRAGITTRRHSRLSMVGAAVNIALGNWLFKGEAARFSGLEFTGLPGKTKSRSDLLLGVEYSGITDATLSLELVNRHQHGHESLLATAGVKKNEVQTALRFQRDFLHDRLHLTYLGSFFEWGKDGGFTRVSLAYDLEDALTVSGGTVIYHHGEKPPFNTIGDNDRVFLDLKYSF